MRKILIPLVTLTMVLIAGSVSARAAERVKDEMGLTRMQAVYPEPGAGIDNEAPMIAADFTSLEIPVDPATVVILLDGIDVTDSADVTVNYVLYKAPKDLRNGKHEVRITAMDEKGAGVEPLSWVFHINAPPVSKSLKPDHTDGKLTVTTDMSRADYDANPIYKVPQILEEKEGMKLNVDFDFSNISGDRTIIGAFHRETQLVTDKEIDKFRLNYFDDKYEASLGHFWVDLSELTIAGAEMGGVKIDTSVHDWSFSLFSGRTQDPSTSGSFKQVTTGARSSYHWNKRHTTSLTYLYAYELDDAFYSQLATPADDRITSLLHEYQYGNNVTAEFEAAANTREVDGAPVEHDSAARFEIKGSHKWAYAEAEAYSIGEFFVPVAEGNRKYTNSNRDGYRGLGRADIAKWLSAGGEYEQYGSDDSAALSRDVTKRANAFVAVSSGYAANVKYSHSKMTVTTGVVSERDMVTAVFRKKEAGLMHDALLSASWQDMDYSNSPMIVNTRSLGLSFRSRFGRRFGISMGYTDSETNSIFQSIFTENAKYSLGMDWDVTPDKLNLSGRFERSATDGRNLVTGKITTAQDEWRLKTMLRYAGNSAYTYLLGYDVISMRDAVNTAFSYDQNIIRSGVEMLF